MRKLIIIGLPFIVLAILLNSDLPFGAQGISPEGRIPDLQFLYAYSGTEFLDMLEQMGGVARENYRIFHYIDYFFIFFVASVLIGLLLFTMERSWVRTLFILIALAGSAFDYGENLVIDYCFLKPYPMVDTNLADWVGQLTFFKFLSILVVATAIFFSGVRNILIRLF